MWNSREYLWIRLRSFFNCVSLAYVQGEGYRAIIQWHTLHHIRKLLYSYKGFNILPKCIAELVEGVKHIVHSIRILLIEQFFYCIDECLGYCMTQM